MTRAPALVAFGLACTACTGGHDKAPDQVAATPDCLAAGGGYLRAQLRGAVTADLDWSGSDMQCDGSPRPDGHGIRLTFAGRLPESQPAGDDGATRPERHLRFIFGIDERDTATGAALAMPTNLTVILEGEQQLFATRGDQHCAVESLERSPVAAANGRKNRVHARGYCLGPATNTAGDARLLVPTFEFTGVADTEL
jgi:hypothetical protein